MLAIVIPAMCRYLEGEHRHLHEHEQDATRHHDARCEAESPRYHRAVHLYTTILPTASPSSRYILSAFSVMPLISDWSPFVPRREIARATRNALTPCRRAHTLRADTGGKWGFVP